MFVRRILAVAALTFVTSCGLVPEPETPQARPEDLPTFVSKVRVDVEAHAWQGLLAASDPVQYRTRVVEGNTPEPQYLAELLGLKKAGNDIQDGPTLEWADFARIRQVTLAPSGEDMGLGQATLLDGSSLSLEIRVTTVQGRYVLTGVGL